MHTNLLRGLTAATITAATISLAAPAAAGARTFANCTALRAVYPHGVGLVDAQDQVRGFTQPVTTFYRNNALYRANIGSDRDRDGVACERL